MRVRFAQLSKIDALSEVRAESDKAPSISSKKRWKGVSGEDATLNPILNLSSLSEPFGTALSSILNTQNSVHSSRNIIGNIKNGFCRFITENELQSIELRSIDTAFANAFINHLNLNHYSVATKRRQLAVFRLIIEWLTHSKWKNEICHDLRIQVNPWPAEGRHKQPIKASHRDQLTAIYAAATAECYETIRRITPALDSLDCSSRKLWVHSDQKLIACLMRFSKNLPLLQKNSNEIRKLNIIDRKLSERLSLPEITAHIAPTARHLVPFVVLFAIHTRLNPDVTLGLKLSEISSDIVLGSPMLKVSAYKPRSRRNQISFIPIDSSADNIKVLYDFLLRWTSRLRSVIDDDYKDSLFIFLSESRGKAIKTFGTNKGTSRSGDITWQHNYVNFCKSKNVEYVPLRALRMAVIDLAFELSNGDLRFVQAIANHRSVETTVNHYKSDSERERQFERLSQIMSARARWVSTEGRIDVRGTPAACDIGASTPGWNCMDPFSSPFWSKDSLCSAYGYCPICPLASIDLHSSYSCAQAFNLLDAVNRSKSALSPHAWLQRMAPVQHALTSRWLPAFPDQILKAASDLVLPPLPTPE